MASVRAECTAELTLKLRREAPSLILGCRVCIGFRGLGL